MVAITGPVNWVEVTCPHQKQVGSFTVSMAYRSGNLSAYLPRWDYGGGTVDTGNTPAARTQASVPASTSITIGFCTFAQGNVNVSNVRLSTTGLSALLGQLTRGNAAQIQYDLQGDGYCHADGNSAAIDSMWNAMSQAGFTRVGTYTRQSIKFTIQTTAANETFTCPFSSVAMVGDVIWGDGSITNELTNGSDSRKVHTYAVGGTYTVTVVGNSINNFAFNNAGDKAKVRSVVELKGLVGAFSNTFYGCSSATGTIPAIPSTVTGINTMFGACSGFTGSLPALPSGLTDGFQAFFGCTGLSGSFPSIPPTMTNGGYMFFNCSGITGASPALSPALTSATFMFGGCTKLSSIPNIGSGLVSATGMFNNCSQATGSIPPLPTTLVSCHSMFMGCSNLTGAVPSLPSSITTCYNMFSGCANLTAPPASIPTAATAFDGIFNGCSNLVGSVPTMPSGATNGTSAFNGCAKLTGNIPALPTSLQLGTNMFSGCAMLTGAVPTLPTTLTDGTNMFAACAGLNGTIPTIPASLVNGTAMFSGCVLLTGTPNLSAATALTNATSMFNNCNSLVGFTWGPTACINFTNTITSCESLDAADVDAFLIWLDTSGAASGTRLLNYSPTGAGDGAATAHLDANRSPAALTAKNSLITKGWVRAGTY